MPLSQKTILQNLNRFLRWGVTLSTLFLSLNSHAEDFFSKYEKKRTLQFFVGSYFATNIRVNNTQSYFNKEPIQIYAPYIRFRWDNFQLTPDKMSYTFFKNLWAEIDLRLSYKGHAYNTDDMSPRHKTIYGGVTLRLLMFKFEALKDISGISDASIFSIATVIPLPISRSLLVILQAEIEFWDAKYTDYYFGVKQSEVTPTRPYYKGKWSKDYNFQMQFQFFWAKRWIAQLSPSFRYYDDTIAASPTVNKRREYALLFGLGYQF
jgi:outer membrane protein